MSLMTAYLILLVEEILDPEEMAEYARKARGIRGPNAEPLIVYGPKSVMEGPDFEGVAMLSFPSVEEARAWYESPQYQAALPHRLRGARSRLVIVEGCDPLRKAGAPAPREA
jgi:uncharacterized protein (DUF1330 family)